VRRLSFATAEETIAATGMMVGGVTPFSLPAELPVFVDARVMRAPDVVLGGGSRSMKVRVAPEVLSRLPNVTVVEGLAFEKEPA
jgi:prolyl-tRNA editing enzyme YbaK/EbsC (Cys-tRNA(Pro) deacylase)